VFHNHFQNYFLLPSFRVFQREVFLPQTISPTFASGGNPLFSMIPISLEELSPLLGGGSSVKSAAVTLLLDRCMMTFSLNHLISNLPANIIVLHQVASHEKNKRKLAKRVLRALVELLPGTTDQVNRYAMATLCQLIADHDKRKLKICEYGIVPKACWLLLQDPKRHTDCKYWCIMLLHHLSLTELATNYLIEHRVVHVLAQMVYRHTDCM
jgi:hypothetical protein